MLVLENRYMFVGPCNLHVVCLIGIDNGVFRSSSDKISKYIVILNSPTNSQYICLSRGLFSSMESHFFVGESPCMRTQKPPWEFFKPMEIRK